MTAHPVKTMTFEGLLACVDRDSLAEAPQNFPPMASWPEFGDTKKTKTAWARSLKSDDGRKPVVYVHVPFCETLCRFCGFYKLPVAPGALDRYLDALEREAGMFAPLFKGRPLRFLCIGGGTPSLLTISQLERLFKILRACFKITPETRIAFESSPNTLDVAKLACLKSAGVEWLAIGVQSFDPVLLKGLNRRQDPAQTIEAIKQARKAGIKQVEVDLMTGLPGQTEKSFLSDVRKVAALDVERVYLFDFQPRRGTSAGGKGGSLQGRELEDARAWRRRGMDILLNKGYEMCCGHWVYKRKGDCWPYSYDQGEEGSYSVLGLGPSAVSYAMNAARYRNVSDERRYESELAGGRLPAGTGCLISKKDEMANFILLDALQRGQLDKRAFRGRFGKGLTEAFPREIGRLLTGGILADSGGALMVSDRERAIVELRRALYSPEAVRRLEAVYGRLSGDGAAANGKATTVFNKAAGTVYECRLYVGNALDRLLYGRGAAGPEKPARELLLELMKAAGAGRAEALLFSGAAVPGELELAAVRYAGKAGFKKVSLFSELPADIRFFASLKAAGAAEYFFRFEEALSPELIDKVSAAAAAGLRVRGVCVLKSARPGPLLAAIKKLSKAGVRRFMLAFPEGAGNIKVAYSALGPLIKAVSGLTAAGAPKIEFLRVPLCGLYPRLELSADCLRAGAGDARESGGGGAVKPQLCLYCRLLLKCPGPARGYVEKFGTKGLKVIK